ncbi:DUF4262 domain-containing protein [Streptomyces sp. MT29]|nr:DUF4262 domain-containing protein [Streptomyces sp. MT29]
MNPKTKTTETRNPTTGGHSHDVLWIFDPAGGDPPFAYTVGLAVRPGAEYELACTGLPAELSCQVLASAVEQLHADGLDPAAGLVLDEVLEDVYTVRLHAVADTSKMRSIPAEFGERPPVWQVVWPDVMHRFPGEPGFVNHAPQPLL